MLGSVQLTLMIGPVVPLTVPRVVLRIRLSEVEVKTEDVGQSGFQLIFSIDKQSPLQILFLLTGGMPLLFMRVVLVATVNGVATVLIDGVITNNEISPGDKGSNSTLTITGKDLTALMDQSDWSGLPFPAMPPEARVALLLAKYALFGIIPLVIPSILLCLQLPIEQIPAQQGTDLAYIRLLADQVGYVFYIDPGPVPGVSKAYWGPQVKIGTPQPSLNADMDAYTNVESLHFTYDQEKNRLPIVYHQQRGDRRLYSHSHSSHHPAQSASGTHPTLPTQSHHRPDLKPFRDDLSLRCPFPQAHHGQALAAAVAGSRSRYL